MSEFYVINN